jgi:ATP-binding cassette subfamily B (MDR/TAP) protein 1
VFVSIIISLGYNKLSSDHHTYYNRLEEDEDFIILLLYMDDILVIDSNKDQVHELKAQLDREFYMKNLKLGLANKILGMQIYQDKKKGRFRFHKKKLFEENLVIFQYARL